MPPFPKKPAIPTPPPPKPAPKTIVTPAPAPPEPDVVELERLRVEAEAARVAFVEAQNPLPVPDPHYGLVEFDGRWITPEERQALQRAINASTPVPPANTGPLPPLPAQPLVEWDGRMIPQDARDRAFALARENARALPDTTALDNLAEGLAELKRIRADYRAVAAERDLLSGSQGRLVTRVAALEASLAQARTTLALTEDDMARLSEMRAQISFERDGNGVYSVKIKSTQVGFRRGPWRAATLAEVVAASRPKA